jgi:Flp pilus assembly protein TadD/mono/diheme cytochrome c family protein
MIGPWKASGFCAIAGIAVGLVGLMGCRDIRSPQTQSESVPTSVTFARDVAPIMFENCAPCHRPNGPAPFSVLDYQSVRTRARQIVDVTQRGFMPPWLPEPGYGRFAGERHLTKDQIDTIHGWVEQGMEEGSPADLPPLPQFSDGWRLGEPDLVIKMLRPYTLQAGSTDVWRNFVIPIPVSETRYVKTVELRPGSARFVHHALMGIDETLSSRRRDAQDADEGFEGMEMGDAHMPDGHLVGWTPGMAPFPGVEGMAWRLEPGTDLVLQLHMLPSGKPEIVEPVVGFYFSETPPIGSPMYLLRLDADDALDIPAGEQDFVVTDTLELPVDVEVLAVYPHAHYVGKSIEGWARLPDGTARPLIRIDDWDFNWQDVYRYAQPISLPAGTTVGMRWRYDNSADNVRNPNHPPKRVVAGNRSSDEMAHLQLQVRLRRSEDLARLQEVHYRHALEKNPRNVWSYYSLGNALWEQGRLAEATRQYRAALEVEPAHAATRNNLGAVLVEQGNISEAIGQFRATLRIEPDFADAHYNLGNALRSQGQLDEAISHYREALRLEPRFAEAHNNLGEVLASQDEVEEAILHFREAVRLAPDSAQAHNNLGAALGLQGKFEEAIREFRRALEIEPDHSNARRNLSLALEAAASTGRVRP